MGKDRKAANVADEVGLQLQGSLGLHVALLRTQKSGTFNRRTIELTPAEIQLSAPTREHALAFLDRAVEQGKFYRAASAVVRSIRKHGGAFPPGAVRYAGTTYFPSRTDVRQRILERELQKFLSTVKEQERKKFEDAIAHCLCSGVRDLEQLRRGVSGVYAVHLPERRIHGEVLLYAGAGLVTVQRKWLGDRGDMMIIKVISGVGKLAWLNEFTGRWISLESFLRDKSDLNLSSELLAFSDHLLRVLHIAYKKQRCATK